MKPQKIQLIQLIQKIIILSFSINCLIELKFFETFSNRCWKFQLSILKNKKKYFKRNSFLSSCQYQNKKSFLYWPNFQWRFWNNPYLISQICKLKEYLKYSRNTPGQCSARHTTGPYIHILMKWMNVIELLNTLDFTMSESSFYFCQK